MIRKRRWRNRKRPAVVREERWGPTPETLAKLEPDPLTLLLDSDPARESRCGRAALESAADEIRAVYMAVTRAVMFKRPSLDSHGGRKPEISGPLAWAHLQTYMPWANQWRHGRVLESAIDVIVDRYQCPPASREWIVVALADYAKRMRERPQEERAA